MKFKTTIGLEIHIQLKTKSKMFCACDNESFNLKPNTNICEICLGMPGTLPVANKDAILWTIKTGLALNCKINDESKFDRKHYFYPDLPKGYQISQYDKPFCINGYLELNNHKINIDRVHLEEDAGKLIHSEGNTYVDLNRAGTPLMEIVTEPDISSPAEAKRFLQDLQLLVRYLDVSEASMEKGHLRCDANIDLKDDDGKMSPIVELKNINSFRFIEKALMIEEKRLADDYNNWPTKKIKLTRGYDSKKNITFPQREKEEASDYRYFPEPDLPPITTKASDDKSTMINEVNVEKIKKEIGSLPSEFRNKLLDIGVEESVADKVVMNPDHMCYLDCGDKLERDLALFVTEEINSQIAKHKISYEEYKKRVPIAHLADLLGFVRAKIISNKIAKEVFSEMVRTGKRAKEIIEEKGLEQISSEKDLGETVDEILRDNPKEFERYKNGEKKLLGFFMGEAMKKTGGKANPSKMKEIIEKKIN